MTSILDGGKVGASLFGALSEVQESLERSERAVFEAFSLKTQVTFL